MHQVYYFRETYSHCPLLNIKHYNYNEFIKLIWVFTWKITRIFFDGQEGELKRAQYFYQPRAPNVLDPALHVMYGIISKLQTRVITVIVDFRPGIRSPDTFRIHYTHGFWQINSVCNYYYLYTSFSNESNFLHIYRVFSDLFLYFFFFSISLCNRFPSKRSKSFPNKTPYPWTDRTENRPEPVIMLVFDRIWAGFLSPSRETIPIRIRKSRTFAYFRRLPSDCFSSKRF